MNPGKLFDYLDGKLSPGERTALEEKLVSDPELRREFAVARQIHADTRDSSESLPNPDQQRGALLSRRIMIAFFILVFANVLFGIYAIAFMNKKARTQLNTQQNRKELADSLSRSAAIALPTPSIDVEEIKFTAPIGEQNELANTILDEAKNAGGSAAKGLADEHGVLLFVEMPTARLNEFQDAMKKLGGSVPKSPPQNAGEKSILQVRIVSAQ
jgi:hypothetical protein